MESFEVKSDRMQQGMAIHPHTVYTRVHYKRKRYSGNTGIKHKGRRLWLSGITAVAFLLCLWTLDAEKQVRTVPKYDKVNIEELLYKASLTGEEYIVLFEQTGLAAVAVDYLREAQRAEELLLLQEKLFAGIPTKCKANTLISREERITDMDPEKESYAVSAERAVEVPRNNRGYIPYVEEGDILITFNSHVLGWRNGHAAMVVDAAKRLVVEARVLGTDSVITGMGHWEQYPSFAVLRLKDTDREKRAEIADYAMQNMVGRPYRLTAGWGNWLYPEEMTEGTQCAHLIWETYEQFGYNLDSDGGMVVTPKDIFESSLLEVVQVYGMPILR